jgi:hypothetical protein
MKTTLPTNDHFGKTNTMIPNELIELIDEYKTPIVKDKRWGFDLEEKEFIKGMCLLTPQAYGSRIESRMAEYTNMKKVSSRKSKGDCVTSNGHYVENKGSIITTTNPFLNLVQIRVFHEIEYYFCQAFDVRDLDNYTSYYFVLTHDEMLEECKNAGNAHGTKKVNKENTNVEKRMSILVDKNDATFKRWCDKYRVDTLEEVKTILNS